MGRISKWLGNIGKLAVFIFLVAFALMLMEVPYTHFVVGYSFIIGFVAFLADLG